MKFKNQVHTSPKTQCLHYKDRPLMKCNELITVCSEKYTTQTHTHTQVQCMKKISST